ncbi:hypothetical protein DYB31_012508, partial [Aphanomyces astaci]
AMKLPVHYIIENPGIPSDMAYRLLANGSAYRLRYDIQEVPHVPHACVTYFNETISPATVYCAVDVALDSRTSKAVVLHYFSDRTTFQHLLTSLAQLDISSSDTTSVALVDSFDNARKRIRIEYVVPHDVARSLVVAHHVMNQPSRDASPILDFCLVLEHPAATVDEIRTQIDAQALMTSLGQYEVVTGVPLVTAIAPYSAMLPPKQLYHVIASLTDAVLEHVLTPLPTDIRDTLSHVLKVQPGARGHACSHDQEAIHMALQADVDQLTQMLLQAKTQLRHVELDRDALQRQLCELVDHFNGVLQDKEETKHVAAVTEMKRASLATQLDTMVHMVMSVIPLAQQVYGQSSDDFLAHTMADAANATVKPSYAIDQSTTPSSLVGLVKAHIRHTIVSKGCIAKWATSHSTNVPSLLDDHPFLGNPADCDASPNMYL